jgi:hypothetical protein
MATATHEPYRPRTGVHPSTCSACRPALVHRHRRPTRRCPGRRASGRRSVGSCSLLVDVSHLEIPAQVEPEQVPISVMARTKMACSMVSPRRSNSRSACQYAPMVASVLLCWTGWCRQNSDNGVGTAVGSGTPSSGHDLPGEVEQRRLLSRVELRADCLDRGRGWRLSEDRMREIVERAPVRLAELGSQRAVLRPLIKRREQWLDVGVSKAPRTNSPSSMRSWDATGLVTSHWPYRWPTRTP